MARKRRPE